MPKDYDADISDILGDGGANPPSTKARWESNQALLAALSKRLKQANWEVETVKHFGNDSVQITRNGRRFVVFQDGSSELGIWETTAGNKPVLPNPFRHLAYAGPDADIVTPDNSAPLLFVAHVLKSIVK